jgi:cellulose synthase operon protein C
MARFDSNALGFMRKNLSEIRREMREAQRDPTRWPYREAAAVLSRFLPDRLRPFGTDHVEREGWDDFLIDSEPVSHSEPGGWWRLRPHIRREALSRLKTRQNMLNALAVNPEHPSDPIQRMFEAVIGAPRTRLDIERLPREDLTALISVCEWLSGILPELPAEPAIRRAVAVGDLLEPMRRLSEGFVGRQSELEQLRDYVGLKVSTRAGRAAWRFARDVYYDLTKRPPIMIVGVGGVGKSTLLARFILDYSEEADGDTALPFVYLDLDLPSIIPSQPVSLIAEAAHQLSVEWPEFADALNSISEQVRRLVLGDEARASLEGTRLLAHRSDVLVYFARILNEGSVGRPVLFVIDTFEEAQFLGSDVIHSIWELLGGLQRECPMLRVVIAGRTFAREQLWSFPAKVVALGDLDRGEARELVRHLVPSIESRDEATINEIIDIVGRNPMSLKLACTLVRDQGVERLRNLETRHWLMLRVKTETVQARLYGRILGHIHEPAVKKLAHPGLLLRRLTPEIIRDVLAEPCGISVNDLATAEILMSELSREVTLVERDPDGSLRHRPDVRRLMLNDLKEDVPAEIARLIHDRAVTYYERLDGPVARAEEIYHRLVRGDELTALDKRWIPGVDPYLRTALDEVPAAARLWLSKRLGVTPDSRLLNMAALEQWEDFTARSALRLLQSGDPSKALGMVQDRRDRSPASPLFRLEAEALRLLDRSIEAREILQFGIAVNGQAGALAANRELLIQLSLLDETSGDLEGALVDVQMAESIRIRIDPIETLPLITTRLRLLRKLGKGYGSERRRAVEESVALIAQGLTEGLERRPALLREVVAELGTADPAILSLGLQALGLELKGESQITLLANALAEWDKRIGRHGKSNELATRAGLLYASTEVTWSQFVMTTSATELGRRILNWRAELRPDRRVDAALTKIYRLNVDAELNLTTGEISAPPVTTEELLRREWHPAGDYQNRGTLTPCIFSIDPRFQEMGRQRWEDWGDLLVRLKAPPNTDDIYLVPSRRAPARFRDPDKLKNAEVLAKKKEATEEFSANYQGQELRGLWFYKTLSRDKRRRVHVYSQEYDDFLNSQPIQDIRKRKVKQKNEEKVRLSMSVRDIELELRVKTPQHVGLAITSLSASDLLRLQSYARVRMMLLLWLNKAKGRDAQDLLQEAILATLDGRRTWRAGVSLQQHLAGAMRSISNGWGQEVTELRPQQEPSPDFAGPNASEAPPFLAITLDPERVLRAKQRLEEIHSIFPEDPIALQVVDLRGQGYTSREIQIELGMSPRQFNAASRRVRRTLATRMGGSGQR